MSKHSFIKTSNEDTYKELLKRGYTFINYSSNMWTFVNDGKMTFSDTDKVIYTNILTF